MAESPLVLTIMARLGTHERLPDQRFKLYQECADELIWRWEQRKHENERSPLEDLFDEADITGQVLELALQDLAFDQQRQTGSRSVPIPTERLERSIGALHPKPHDGKAWASRVVAILRERSGLLVAATEDEFRYPHPSFQEYMAACGLERRADRVTLGVELAGDTAWEESVPLAVAATLLNASPRVEFADGLLARLLHNQRIDSAAGRRRLMTAGRILLELEKELNLDPDLGKRNRKTAFRRLQAMMISERVPARARLQAGLLLADLGDLPDDLDEFILIEPNPALGVDYPFWIGKYPVTNYHFQQFVKGGGYQRGASWWSDEAKEELGELLTETGVPSREVGSRRAGMSANFGGSTQPVVGVNFYEAMGYAGWVEERRKERNELPTDHRVALPSEEEWISAAGGAEGYPWGDTFDASKANTEKSDLGGTTPVHMYPGGASPAKIWDLVGNVWEWTRDRDEDGWPLLMGESWWGSVGESSLSISRLEPKPLLGISDLGFRLVVVPSSRLISES